MNRSFVCFFFFLLVLIPVLSAESDTTTVKVEVDRAFATIGDRINFRVTVLRISVSVVSVKVNQFVGLVTSLLPWTLAVDPAKVPVI